ncbi:hypothetical protein [Thermoleptolyngbya sp. C42_A2020_037]|uniref:hypothetical protein n=1 Tax=Thermoleptolyngbya sp. C42_A2020_037 TaxID=2747799 RepID=UPI0019E493F6|nr:hypothetical protein [Thermoleptolyngbya sp. C42_A2020_037]MBF2083005.1 hypothetical protein [Thermoleptolyngbya sp. C42_A2020_037]
MFEVCLSCAAAEALMGICLTEVLAIALGHVLMAAYEQAVEEGVRQFFSKV